MDAITISNDGTHYNFILKCPLIYAEYTSINVKFLRATIIKMWSNL